MDSRYIAFGMFGIALAAVCWRVSAVMNTENLPTAIPMEEVPDVPVALVASDPRDVVGISYLPGPPVNVPLYRANVPAYRPGMPAPPRVAA